MRQTQDACPRIPAATRGVPVCPRDRPPVRLEELHRVRLAGTCPAAVNTTTPSTFRHSPGALGRSAVLVEPLDASQRASSTVLSGSRSTNTPGRAWRRRDAIGCVRRSPVLPPVAADGVQACPPVSVSDQMGG